MPTVHQRFERYLTTIDGVQCYIAGLPGYQRNFTRDTIIAGMLALDHHLLDSQLHMSCVHQGTTFDPLTGEEPGKIHHEYPGIMVHAPYISTYNACDTTALYLIGLESLRRLSRHESKAFLEQHGASVERAMQYIQRHLKANIFWEFPPEGAKHFSPHTTYWKDSVVPDPSHEEPRYPVAYGLAQIKIARGVLAAAHILERDDLHALADAMFKAGLAMFITKKAFCVEQDQRGRLEQSSSDELHALAFLPPEYQDMLPLDAICERALPLITPAGIACTPRGISEQLRDTYHGYVVWIFEQALIHYGATKFGLVDLANATLGCTSYIEAGQELLNVVPAITPLGNRHQLWSVAAQVYFSNEPSLKQTDWL